MIPRYEKSEISSLWNEHAKFSSYLEVELAILKSLEPELVPQGTAENIKSKVTINPERINEIEKTTRHDIIAFCTSITENLTAEEGKYFHFGVTSSDIIDSAMNLQIKRSLDIIRPAFKNLLHALHERSVEMKDIMTIGRSHGMYAEPMSFGQKLLGFYNEFARHYKSWETWYEDNLTVQFSGAVGNYTILSPEQEEKAADSLNMKVEPLSTQVIPRDRLASLISIHGLIASAMERFCVEIRHLHRSDVGELHEGFKKGQKGSSTMPHKKNPISGENLTGMARVLRSHVHMALENIILWHERDISHSSTERMYLPDNLGLMLYSLERLTDTVKSLVFNNENIEKRVFEQHNYLSSYYLHQLLKQTDIKREDLYYFVQDAAFKSKDDPNAEAFHGELVKICVEKNIDIDLKTPTKDELKNIYLGNTDKVFKRSLELYPLP